MRPVSTSLSATTDITCLLIDPVWNRVPGVHGGEPGPAVRPTACRSIGLPPRVTSIVPDHTSGDATSLSIPARYRGRRGAHRTAVSWLPARVDSAARRELP